MFLGDAVRAGLRGDVIVTAVMDEEYAGLGTLAVAERYRADGAIVAEAAPTTCESLVVVSGDSGYMVTPKIRKAPRSG